MRRIFVFFGVIAVTILPLAPARAQAETMEEMKERIRQEVTAEYGPAPVKKQAQPGQFRAAPAQEKTEAKAAPQKLVKQPAVKKPMDMSLPFGVSPEAAVKMVVVMMFFAVIPGVIARLKGRSFIAWWLLGTLFFIFVLPIAVFMKSLKPARAPKPARPAPKTETPPTKEAVGGKIDEKPSKTAERPPNEQGNEAVDVYNKIEKLAELKSKGLLTEEEFKAKKNELLSRI